MSSEAIISEARLFLDELVTRGNLLQKLLNHGTLPDGWSSRYLAFVERVAQHYGDTEPLPREILAIIYTASCYCTKRYHDWQRLSGETNAVTHSMVSEIRWAGDALLLRRYWHTPTTVP